MEHQYAVFIDSPPFPSRGYFLRSVRIPKGKTFDDIRDELPATVVNHVEITARNHREAQALGLRQLVNGD